jgi:hypothetical protein
VGGLFGDEPLHLVAVDRNGHRSSLFLGGDVFVNRLGYGAMRITGPGSTRCCERYPHGSMVEALSPLR